MGEAVKTESKNTSLPLFFRREACHVGTCLANLSTSGCRSVLESLVVERGSPRYWIGKSIKGQPRIRITYCKSIPWHLIGDTELLSRLQRSPAARPNIFSNSTVATASWTVGFISKTTVISIE
jgi:hypothetical protein